RRVRQRGYNQSVLLAREVSKLTGIAVAEDMLIKTRDSAPQVSLATQEERARNAEGSFLAVRESAGEAVLLIDDVVTTGSTMAACAKAAKEKGAASV
ncbi:MAG: ComF family protein, partial [Dehalococcoidia bacterium]